MTLLVPRLPFSLDPLIAEAKRRARQRRGLVAIGALLILAGAAGAALALRSPNGPPTTPSTYDTALRPSSGPSGSTVTVSGTLPVVSENGAHIGQTATEVSVYWNLDFKKWWSALGRSPLPSSVGSPVRLLGRQDVAKIRTYQVRVKIPSAPPGRYPIEVLYSGPDSGGPSFASFAPTTFQVTGG
jgi:hypothetical protein